MSYSKLGLINGEILSDIHITHIENGVSNVVKEADNFKKVVANILNSKGVPTYETDSLDKITQNINLLGHAINHNDSVDEEMIDIRETCPSGCIQLLCTDERTARVRFYITTSDASSYTVD